MDTYIYKGVVEITLIFLLVLVIITVVVQIQEKTKLRNITKTTKEITNVITETIESINEGEPIKIMEQLKNKKSLEELVKKRAKQEDYDDFVEKVISLINPLYEEYRFLLQEPTPNDYESGYALIFQVFRGETPEEYEYLFRLAIDKGLEEGRITRTFIDYMKKEKFIKLEGATVSDIGTGISSILQAEDIRVLISFYPEEYLEKQTEEREKKKIEEKQKEEEQKEADIERKLAYNKLGVTTSMLNKVEEEVLEMFPEYQETYENLKELYDKSL